MWHCHARKEWKAATGRDSALGVADDLGSLPAADSPAMETAWHAIGENIRASCGAPLSEALGIQAQHSAEFMVSKPCLKSLIGSDYTKTTKIR